MSESQIWVVDWRWTILPDMEEMEFRGKEEDLKDWLHRDCDAWVFQLEKGKETGKLHYQGFAKLKEKDRPRHKASALNKDFRGIRVVACSTNGKEALRKYCMKSDTRLAGPWADKPVYMGEDLPVTLKPWQETCMKTLLGAAHPRKIFWYYDDEGGKGKSIFAKYMMFHHEIPKLCYGTANDLLNLVSKYPGRKGYIFDLTRTKPATFSSEDMYSVMEDIKNGYFNNLKYETGFCLMAIPNIVVFANHRPLPDKLSADRFEVIDLSLFG